MNRTLVIFNLLVSSISIAKSINEVTTANIEGENYKIDDTTLIPDEIVLPVLVKKDDIITSSDINKLYSSVENKFSKTRSLKDEAENEKFRKADLKEEIPAAKLKSDEKFYDKSEEKSNTSEKDAENDAKSANKDEISAERRSINAEVEEESKSGSKEESKTLERSSTNAKVDSKPRNAKKEKSGTEEGEELKKTTETSRREIKNADYLEHHEDESNVKVSPNENLGKKGYEMPVNDESNSAWDLLDDIPTSRRMLSQPDNTNIEVKAKAGNENVDPVEARNVPETKIASRQRIPYGPTATPVIPIPQIQSSVLFPHIHPAMLPGRRFIVPGFIKIQPAVSIDFRRLLNQERYGVINQNIPHDRFVYKSGSNNAMNQNQKVAIDNDDKSEIPPEPRYVSENNSSEANSNAYPYTPVDTETPKMAQKSTVNTVMAKLIEASEHPQRLIPNNDRETVRAEIIPNLPNNNNMRPNNYANFNAKNVQNDPGISYRMNVRPANFAAPQNYGVYKYVTGFGRSR